MFTERTEYWLRKIFPEKVLLPGSDGVIVPSGSTGQRPFPPDPGTVRYNTTNAALEVYIGAPVNAWEEIAGGSSGAVKSASNVGAGEGVFKQKVGSDLEFKSLLAGGGVTITDLGDELQISSSGGGSGEANTASNIGGGIGVFANKVGVDLQFKSLNSLEPTLTIVDGGGGNINLDMTGAPYLSLSGGTMTGNLDFQVGAYISAAPSATALEPSYNFSGNTDTGMWSPAADELGFATGGTERLRIGNTGALTVPTGYESLVVADEVLTNKKYVDNAIATMGAVSVYRQAFTNASLTAGVAQFAHNLGENFVNLTIYDNFNKVIIPAEITVVDPNTINVDLNSFGTLVGNWHVVVVG